MKSGKLALLNSDKDRIENGSFEVTLPDNSPFDTLLATIRIDESTTLKDGSSCYIGRAAQEDVQHIDAPEVTENGEIEEQETVEKITRVTSFLLVPDEFVIVGSSAGEFLFPLLNEQTGHKAFPAEISVDRFSSDYEDGEYWKVGFTGRGDGAENGVLHGGTVLNDSVFGAVVGGSNKNQLGVNFDYDGVSLKLFITESGYVNVYNEYESEEFAEFVLNGLMDYARMK